MSLFELCLASEMTANVILNGEPVVGAEVVRSIRWSNKKKSFEDKTETDTQGTFKFPAKYASSVLYSIPIFEPVINQVVTIHHQGNEYLIWDLFKREYDENTELGIGKEIRLTCDLANKEETKASPNSRYNVTGICTWE